MPHPSLEAFIESDENAVFVGMPCGGKSTVGPRVVTALNEQSPEGITYGYVETDAEIISQEGMSIAEIFETLGEAGFRRIEAGVIGGLANRRRLGISPGGGACTDKSTGKGNVEVLKRNGTLIYLAASPATIQARVEWGRRHGVDNRPLFQGLQGDQLKAKIEELYELRVPTLEEIADVTVNTDRLPAERVTELVLRGLGELSLQ